MSGSAQQEVQIVCLMHLFNVSQAEYISLNLETCFYYLHPNTWQSPTTIAHLRPFRKYCGGSIGRDAILAYTDVLFYFSGRLSDV